MDELIARALSGEASDVELSRLDQWRRASPDNERRYRALAHVWALGALAEPRRPLPPVPAAADIIAEAERRRREAIPLASRRLRRIRPLWWAAAAVVVAGIGLERWRAGAVLEYATGSAQTRTVALGDGSVVRLGPGSRLSVRKADQRSTELRGVAFFAVATDSTHPFVVRTEAGTLQVLGTRFEARADAGSLRLVVVEGRVRLTGGGARVEVARGRVGRVTGGSRPRVEDVPDVWALLDWPHGVLLFQATPLAEVLREIGGHFGRPFVIRDSLLAGRTVTAWFEDEPVEAVVNTVCLVVGAHCVVGDTIEVRR
jgi:transmembrane sensor